MKEKSQALAFFIFTSCRWTFVVDTFTIMALLAKRENLTCTVANLVNMSQLCLREDLPDNNECFQKDISTSFSTFAAVWCIVIAAVGFLGNLLTLMAIPYARKKRR